MEIGLSTLHENV